MKAGKLVCGLLAIHVMGAVALSLLVWRSASQPVPQRVTSTEQRVVEPRPRRPDPLEVDRPDPRRMILYREHELRGYEQQQIRDLLKAFGSRQLESPPRRQWLLPL
jgi:hypothetical protein